MRTVRHSQRTRIRVTADRCSSTRRGDPLLGLPVPKTDLRLFIKPQTRGIRPVQFQELLRLLIPLDECWKSEITLGTFYSACGPRSTVISPKVSNLRQIQLPLDPKGTPAQWRQIQWLLGCQCREIQAFNPEFTLHARNDQGLPTCRPGTRGRRIGTVVDFRAERMVEVT
ncbi:hypothetical protein J6590_029976 [Homalodisca vitripennis]|nr:hypothetical protein J6590_029976 [Homalodisca vitripennis]